MDASSTCKLLANRIVYLQMPTHRTLTLKEQLRASGFRATPGRLAVAEFLEKNHRPLGTPELVKALVPRELDLTSLYRTLSSFTEEGLVKLVPLDQRFASYEWVHEDDAHHHHLVCKICGLIEEISQCHLETLEKRVLDSTPRFKEITSHSLEFFGTCTSCAKKRKTSA